MPSAASPDPTGGQPRSDTFTAWGLVGLQFALIAVVVLWPNGDLWSFPTAVNVLLSLVSAASLVLMAVAALGLGRGLTAAPMPNAHAQLRTGGLYRFVRHPIYTGLLLFGWTQVLSAASWVVVVAAIALTILLNVKARWEESRLTRRFAGYPEYAARTPRFFPHIGG